jgi:hypothetical protein
MTLIVFAKRLLIALGAACATPVMADPCSLRALAWMAGTWHDSANPAGAQERWALAPGALMGSAWSFPLGGKSGFAEIMSVRQDGETLSLVLRHFDTGLSHAWEERDAPMVFRASQCAQGTVLFDGQGARAGEHLSYERSGERLHVVGDFIHDGKAVRVEWQMVRGTD